MPEPVLGNAAQELYDGLEPLTYAEAETDYALAKYSEALGMQHEDVYNWSLDWSQLLDVLRTPIQALGWLAQFVGVRLRAGLSDADQRARVQNTDGWKRGTPGSIPGAATPYLTGPKVVIVRERSAIASPADPAYGIQVVTYADQTPDSDAVLAAILEQKPAGLKMLYQVHNGQDFLQLKSNYATFADVSAHYPTFADVADDEPPGP